MTTPISAMNPFYTPMVRMMAMQTRFAIETSQGMMKLAMMPWAGLPVGLGSICAPMGGVAVKGPVSKTAPVAQTPANVAEPKPEPAKTETTSVEAEAPTPARTAAHEPKAAPTPKPEPAAKAEPEAKAEPAAKVEAAPVANVATEAAAETAPDTDSATMIKPAALKAPKGKADDLTALNGVGPKLAEALHAEGIFHYAQIAGWSDENVAWADENLPGVPGRASREGWVAQAAQLAK